MGIKVYGYAPSSSTAFVLLTLYEKEVTDFELVGVNLFKWEQHSPQHVSKQPFGKIPYVEDGDLTLFESRAIIRCLADKYAGQGTDLYPQNLKDRAAVDQWLEVEAQCLVPPVSQIGREVFYAPMIYGRESDQAVIAANVVEAGKVMDVLDDRLSTSKYLAGDFFSLADLVFLPTLFHLSKEFGELVQNRKHVQAWWQTISDRPVYKKWEAEVKQILSTVRPNSPATST